MSTSADTSKCEEVKYYHPTWFYILLALLCVIIIISYIVSIINSVRSTTSLLRVYGAFPGEILKRIDNVLSALPHMGTRVK